MPYATEHVEAQQDGLLAEVGTWPADGEYRLYNGDPTDGGVELVEENGYAHVSAASVTWAAVASEGAIEADFAWTATDAWDEVGEFWGFHDSDGSLRFYEELVNGAVRADAAGAVTATFKLTYAFDFAEE